MPAEPNTLTCPECGNQWPRGNRQAEIRLTETVDQSYQIQTPEDEAVTFEAVCLYVDGEGGRGDYELVCFKCSHTWRLPKEFDASQGGSGWEWGS
jgi:hypothetical protein